MIKEEGEPEKRKEEGRSRQKRPAISKGGELIQTVPGCRFGVLYPKDSDSTSGHAHALVQWMAIHGLLRPEQCQPAFNIGIM